MIRDATICPDCGGTLRWVIYDFEQVQEHDETGTTRCDDRPDPFGYDHQWLPDAEYDARYHQ